MKKGKGEVSLRRDYNRRVLFEGRAASMGGLVRRPELERERGDQDMEVKV